MSELDPRFTFDTFVVGPANRLASAAAKRAAESPGKSYNPLFLYSPSGLGKSHILGAIAHQVQKSHPERKVEYETVEQFLEALTEALAAGNKDQIRERYRGLDILLLDDVQFLAGQAEAQEMILATLDSLTAADSQIVLASDRPPSEINGLDARLVSRFSGGLMVDIAPPEFETRVAIIRKRVEEQGQTLEPGVAEALARVRFKNVRELGGSLNRILAIQDLEGRRLTAADIPELVGGAQREEEPLQVDPALGSFLSEVAGALSNQVKVHEEPWRVAIREVAEGAEREGFSTRRLRGLIQADSAPSDWGEQLEAFRKGVARLREIDEELDRLNNPWTDAAATLVKDPDRLDEAEAFLSSVRERMRPFPELAPGPDLAAVASSFPTLAVKAAEQLARADRPQYNPLYFWSSSPEGGRALLAATGRSYRQAFPDSRLAVTSVSEFAEDFIRALSDGVAGAWRERWWTVDLLLVHDAQALSDTERAQDEFFHMFEALKRRGARVLLVSDREPAGIRGIDERLRSRFEGGLVLEVEANSLPSGADALVVSGDSPPAAGDSRWEGLSEDESAAAGETSSGTATERQAREAAAGKEGSWLPTGESVVWVWPEMNARLVEEL
jgi:chromosomal replication initiation ATPase DnaA